MSIYDFNHNEHATNNNHANSNGGTSNMQQVTRYQVEGDYLSRGAYSSAATHHQMDNMSNLQLTRPTSKTAMLVRQRRAMLEQLSCFLCKGYLIDATTIDECMDSFCKSCIVTYLRNHNNCPKCGTLIHKTNPLSTIRSDKVLQDIVYKLVPGLYGDEMKRRRDFYKAMFAIPSSDEDDEDGSSSSFTGRCSNMSSEQYGVISHPKPFYTPTDSIDLSIEPQTRGESTSIYYDNKRQSIVTCFTGNFQQQHQPPNGSMFSAVDSQQFKTYLRCPAKLTTLQLKKFIAAKFNICRDDTMHLLYLNESLKDEYSLIDIAYIYDWRGIEHMRLFYIIERDLTKMDPDSGVCQLESELSQSKTSQSVGTSTRAVKRVCIDPHPKYYEEQNKRIVVSGRNMRPRIETTPESSNKTSTTGTQMTHAPILRSCSSGRQSSNFGVAQSSSTNGVANRELATARGSNHNEIRTAPFTSAVTSAISELSRLKQQDNQKDTRSSRKLIADSAGSIPKINISLSKSHDSNAKNVNTYSKTPAVDAGNRQREVIKHDNNPTVRQLLPYGGPGPAYSVTPSSMRPSQSSMVTLASFTEARSNHVMAMSTGSAATIASSYKNILGVGTSSKLEVKSDVKTTTTTTTNQLTQMPQVTPQLAFSFVTERGITIVRRLNSHDEASVTVAGSSASSNNRASSYPALPAPISTQQGGGCSGASGGSGNMEQVARSTSSQFSNSAQHKLHASTSGGTQTNISHTSGHHESGTSARHHMKVKPVYKTFVDPTKLKSPNFKKLGYTARH